MSTDKNSAELDQHVWTPSFSPWLIAITVILPTFMEILDTSVANVAVPHMAGSFSATYDEATWVLTSYLVANAIILPTTAWFGGVFGRKRFLIGCIAIFTIASLMCGLANSIEMLIFARILQGLGGGTLQPVSQAILLESFPRDKVGTATAVFGVGVVLAPVIGPTLGGWITDNLDWRWIFYINIPIGFIAIIMCQLFIEDPPYIKKLKASSIDFIGFGFMALGLAALQIMLDKGQQLDWFSNTFIQWMAGIAFVCLTFFIIWELRIKNPIVNLKILSKRNFAVGTILMFATGIVLYGTILMLSLFLQNLMGYTAELSGIVLSPRGIGSIISIIIAGKLANKVDNRLLILIGLIILVISNVMLGNLNLEIAFIDVVIPSFLGGSALGFIFIPLMTLAFANLKRVETEQATGLFNLLRNIGGGVGISITTTLLAQNAQKHQAYMVRNLTPYDLVFQERLNEFTQFFMSEGNDIATATQKAYQAIYNILIQQATLFSFIDLFRLYAILGIILIPTLLLFKKVK